MVNSFFKSSKKDTESCSRFVILLLYKMYYFTDELLKNVLAICDYYILHF